VSREVRRFIGHHNIQQGIAQGTAAKGDDPAREREILGQEIEIALHGAQFAGNHGRDRAAADQQIGLPLAGQAMPLNDEAARSADAQVQGALSFGGRCWCRRGGVRHGSGFLNWQGGDAAAHGQVVEQQRALVDDDFTAHVRSRGAARNLGLAGKIDAQIPAAQRTQMVQHGPQIQIAAVQPAAARQAQAAAQAVGRAEFQMHASGQRACAACRILLSGLFPVQVQAQIDVREQHAQHQVLITGLVHAQAAGHARRGQRAPQIEIQGYPAVETAVRQGQQAPDGTHGPLPAHLPGQLPPGSGFGQAVRAEKQRQAQVEAGLAAAQGLDGLGVQLQPRGQRTARGAALNAAHQGQIQRGHGTARHAQTAHAQPEIPAGPGRAAAEPHAGLGRAQRQSGHQRAPGFQGQTVQNDPQIKFLRRQRALGLQAARGRQGQIQAGNRQPGVAVADLRAARGAQAQSPPFASLAAVARGQRRVQAHFQGLQCHQAGPPLDVEPTCHAARAFQIEVQGPLQGPRGPRPRAQAQIAPVHPFQIQTRRQRRPAEKIREPGLAVQAAHMQRRIPALRGAEIETGNLPAQQDLLRAGPGTVLRRFHA